MSQLLELTSIFNCKYVRTILCVALLRTSTVGKMQGNSPIAEEWDEPGPFSREPSCPLISKVQRRFLLSPISWNSRRSTSLRLERTQVKTTKEADASITCLSTYGCIRSKAKEQIRSWPQTYQIQQRLHEKFVDSFVMKIVVIAGGRESRGLFNPRVSQNDFEQCTKDVVYIA